MWIETADMFAIVPAAPVTPRAGVWIETHRAVASVPAAPVTPRAGVWIETHSWYHHQTVYRCHSPCGSVD